jgi:hypothetical protein
MTISGRTSVQRLCGVRNSLEIIDIMAPFQAKTSPRDAARNVRNAFAVREVAPLAGLVELAGAFEDVGEPGPEPEPEEAG